MSAANIIGIVTYSVSLRMPYVPNSAPTTPLERGDFLDFFFSFFDLRFTTTISYAESVKITSYLFVFLVFHVLARAFIRVRITAASTAVAVIRSTVRSARCIIAIRVISTAMVTTAMTMAMTMTRLVASGTIAMPMTMPVGTTGSAASIALSGIKTAAARGTCYLRSSVYAGRSVSVAPRRTLTTARSVGGIAALSTLLTDLENEHVSSCIASSGVSVCHPAVLCLVILTCL